MHVTIIWLTYAVHVWWSKHRGMVYRANGRKILTYQEYSDPHNCCLECHSVSLVLNSKNIMVEYRRYMACSGVFIMAPSRVEATKKAVFLHALFRVEATREQFSYTHSSRVEATRKQFSYTHGVCSVCAPHAAQPIKTIILSSCRYLMIITTNKIITLLLNNILIVRQKYILRAFR